MIFVLFHQLQQAIIYILYLRFQKFTFAQTDYTSTNAIPFDNSVKWAYPFGLLQRAESEKVGLPDF